MSTPFQTLNSAIAPLLPRPRFVVSAVILTLWAIGCKSADVLTDDFALGEAIVRGKVTDPAGRPVRGATVTAHAAPSSNNCELLKNSSQHVRSGVTDSLGAFMLRVDYGPIPSEQAACVAVNVNLSLTRFDGQLV